MEKIQIHSIFRRNSLFFGQILMKKHQFRNELFMKISNEIFYLIKVNYLF